LLACCQKKGEKTGEGAILQGIAMERKTRKEASKIFKNRGVANQNRRRYDPKRPGGGKKKSEEIVVGGALCRTTRLSPGKSAGGKERSETQKPTYVSNISLPTKNGSEVWVKRVLPGTQHKRG